LEAPKKANIIPGKGIEAVIKSKGKTIKVHIGTSLFLQEILDINVPAKHDKYISTLRKSGCTVIFVAVEGVLVGSIAVADVVKPSAKSVIDALKNQNIEVWMITGDHKSTANFIANQLGIDHVIAEALPLDKAKLIKEIQAKGRRVAMLGDGVNDAVALSQADVGVAVGTAADLSLEVADVVMLSDNLYQLVVALDLCKVVYRRIKINLVWAFGYNLIVLPLAAGILYPIGFSIPPAFAGLSDLLSSLPVILFSLLLHLYKAPKQPTVELHQVATD
jgi:Cu+-exporting ATPase